MHSIRSGAAIATAALFCVVQTSTAQTQTFEEALQTPGGLVTKIYELVSWEAGESPDFDLVKSMFHERATVVSRSSRTATSVFTVDGFIEDFVNFRDSTPAGENGFTERVVKMSPSIVNDMASVWVLYEAQILGSQRPPQRGVDNFQLVRKDGRWFILGLTNEVLIPGVDLPDVLQH